MTAQWVAAWSALGALVVAVLARWPGRSLWRLFRGTAQFLEDWHGEPERRGAADQLITPARPGVMERIGNVENHTSAIAKIVGYQLQRNDGHSMLDKVTRIDDRTAVQQPAPSIHIHTDGKESA